MPSKNTPKHDDMRNTKNKQQYTTVANRDMLRSFADPNRVQQKTSDSSKKKEGE